MQEKVPRNRVLYAAYLAGRILDTATTGPMEMGEAIRGMESLLKAISPAGGYMQFESQPKRNARAVRTLTNVIQFINRK